MLTIRTSQMEAFDAIADDRIAERLLALLQDRLRGTLDGDALARLRPRIRAAIARARRLNFRWDISVADFAMMDLKYGPGFDRHPDVAPVLSAISQTASPDAELFFVFSRVPAPVWAQLQADAASRPEEGALHAGLLEL